ncbi:hypothetical protein M422DRAFT_268127 [Sphaerobolus stellatus SS14]|uniref:XPG-I domain-containing protein n=1 Tax=Sphaerobolus stellatus (strain SS14) TaxID=990650 RepID=A0A0C9UZ16_SPHS4|nr:hypothetical protein M422DRAFT_268127 [Sphaerobolus stellatus SS14]
MKVMNGSTVYTLSQQSLLRPPYTMDVGGGFWGVVNRLASKTCSLLRLCTEDGFQANHHQDRKYQLGVDAPLLLYQARSATGGPHPYHATLFFKLTRFLAIPVAPNFAFDGHLRHIKEGRNKVREPHSQVLMFIDMLKAFSFNYRMAPGEAEAELARMNIAGEIDAIFSNDSNCFLFGGTTIL